MNKEFIIIVGRRWQDVNGNTYHTAEIIGQDVQLKTDITYGYGGQYLTSAEEILQEYNDTLKNYNYKYLAIDVDRKGNL